MRALLRRVLTMTGGSRVAGQVTTVVGTGLRETTLMKRERLEMIKDELKSKGMGWLVGDDDDGDRLVSSEVNKGRCRCKGME